MMSPAALSTVPSRSPSGLGVRALLSVVALLALGIAADGYRAAFGVAAWHLWGGIGVLAVLCVLTGQRRVAVEPAVTPWQVALDARQYETALQALMAAVRATPDALTLYADIADVYLLDAVALPADAVTWLTAAIERADDSPFGAELRFRRAEILHRSLGASRQAMVDLLTIEKRFPETALAGRAAAFRERMRVTRRPSEA